MTRAYKDEEVYAYKYLKERHLLNPESMMQLDQLTAFLRQNYDIVPCERSTTFYDELAEKLIDLWPKGNKEGKFPWRDSKKNISMRLHCLWQDRKLPDYTIEQCTTVARNYLAQFADNNKYMKTLKYFISKRTEGHCSNTGRITYNYQSTFADMLESMPISAEDAVDMTDLQDYIYGGELL